MICLFFNFPIPPFFRSPDEFKTNTYTYNFRSELNEMIQSAFRLLQTRIKNRMAFTQIEWILAIEIRAWPSVFRKMSVQVTFLGMYRMQFVFTSTNMSALRYTFSSAIFFFESLPQLFSVFTLTADMKQRVRPILHANSNNEISKLWSAFSSIFRSLPLSDLLTTRT